MNQKVLSAANKYPLRLKIGKNRCFNFISIWILIHPYLDKSETPIFRRREYDFWQHKQIYGSSTEKLQKISETLLI
jgi:hypothetical protein